MKRLLALIIVFICLIGMSSISYAGVVKGGLVDIINSVEETVASVVEEDKVEPTTEPITKPTTVETVRYDVNYALTERLLVQYGESVASIKKDGNKDLLNIKISDLECNIEIYDNMFYIKCSVVRVDDILSCYKIINEGTKANDWLQYYVAVQQANSGVIAVKHTEYVDLAKENLDYEFNHVMNVIKNFVNAVKSDSNLFK